jgi:ABC-type uncharacterized transport system substrate-binding protein
MVRFNALLLLGLHAGCVFVPTEVPVATPPPSVTPPPAPVVETPPAPMQPARPAPVSRAPERPVRTAVLLSDDIPVFEAVAAEIVARVGADRATIYNLNALPSNGPRVLREAAAADRIVAVGLLAATIGRSIAEKPMVFCMVFNHQDSNLISASSKGVKLLPPFELQLQAWSELSPRLQSVGVITGPGQEELLAEIEAAAKARGIAVAVETVNSDKEALVVFKQMTSTIQGLWLVPDNRILSPEVVREIMSYSARHQKQVVVFGSNLLGLGAVMSVDSDADDVAQQVVRRLDGIDGKGQVAGPGMLPLTKMQVEVNSPIARQLGLVVPQKLLTIASADE